MNPSSSVQTIFNEVIQALEPLVQDRALYIQRLRQAHRFYKAQDLPGLLDLLDSLQPEQPQSDAETVEDLEAVPPPPPLSSTLPNRRRNTTTPIRFSMPEKQVLRYHFDVVRDYWPSLYVRNVLAKMFNVTPRSLYSWFANERRLKNITRADTPVLLSRDEERRFLLQYRIRVGRPTMAIPTAL